MSDSFNYFHTSPFIMAEPNENITLFEGSFTLKNEEVKFDVQGTINFTWFPSTANRFKGNVIDATPEIKQALFANHEYEMAINGDNFGDCFIVSRNINFDSNEIKISGILVFEAVMGDRTISVDKIKFVIPNLRWFNGKHIIDQQSGRGYNGRLQFETDDHLITIDQLPNHKSLSDTLQFDLGGYVILYSGELTCKKGKLNYKTSQEIFHCFSIFITFLNGRRTSPMMRQGIFEEKTLWTDYLPYNVDIYKSVYSWPSQTEIDGINEMWVEFYRLWNSGHKSFLIAAIHWYIEANANSGFTEGSIIMAQTNLELLYNWALIEDKKLLLGRDAENISASNKLRLLLSSIGCPYSVPKTLNSLQTFIEGSTTLTDAPEAFVQVRNAIVHSNANKREKLNDANPKVKSEALRLGIWYIELALLCILKFKGIYYDRCLNIEEKLAFNGI